MPILGKITPVTTDIVHLYTVPTGKTALVTFSAINTSNIDESVSLYLRDQSDLSVSSISITNTGTGLMDFPDLTIVGDGNPEAEAEVTALTLTSAALTNTSSGFEANDTVVFTVNDGEDVVIKIIAVDTNGAVVDYEIVEGGTITSLPNKSIIAQTSTSGAGEDLGIDVGSMKFGIKSVTVTNSGNNYTSTPSIEVSDGAGFEFDVQMKAADIELADAIEYKVWLDKGGVIERSGLLLGAGDSLFVEGKVNALLLGIESLA